MEKIAISITKRIAEVSTTLIRGSVGSAVEVDQPANEISIFLKAFRTADAHLIYFDDLKNFFKECSLLASPLTYNTFSQEISRFLKEVIFKKYILNRFYINESVGTDFLDQLAMFETVLYNANKKYRDHFIHQFWVFALGTYILNHNCSALRKQYINSANRSNGENLSEDALDLSWIFVGLFHDLAVPIEQTEYWLNNFFKNYFPTDQDHLFDITLGKLLRDNGYQEKINCLSTLFESTQKGTPWRSKKHIECKNNFYLSQMFFKRLSHFSLKDAKLKPHALLSALTLLIKFSHPTDVPDEQIQNVDRIIYPASLAISLHHLHPMGNDVSLPQLEKILFSKNILTYILIFSDAAQEWYRMVQDDSVEAKLIKFYFSPKSATNFTIKLDWEQTKPTNPELLKAHIDKLKNHLEFLKAIPKKFLQNDIKDLLKMKIIIKTPWKSTEIIHF